MTIRAMTARPYHSVHNPAINYNAVFLVFTNLNARAVEEETKGFEVDPDRETTIRMTLITGENIPDPHLNDATLLKIQEIAGNIGYNVLDVALKQRLIGPQGPTTVRRIVIEARGLAKELTSQPLDFCLDFVEADSKETRTAVLKNIHIGDIIESTNQGAPLRSGGAWYECAIVASLAPLILVSIEGDMVWSSTVRPQDWRVISKATKAQFDRIVHRLDADVLKSIERHRPK